MTTTDDELLARLEANKAIAKAFGWTVWQDVRPDRHGWFIERPSKPGYIQAMPLPDYVGEIERHRAEVERLTRERDEAYKLIYVPGLWECVKCGCNLVVTEMHAATGAMRASKEPQRCPNDCGPMWRKTERKAGNELVDRLDAEITKRHAAESALAAAQKRVGVLEDLAREVAYDDGTRDTVSEHNAFPFFSKLNLRLCELRDKARAVLVPPARET